MSDPKRPKTEAGVEAEQKELKRRDAVQDEFFRRWRYLYEKSLISNRNNYNDYYKRLEALELGLNPVLSPGELQDFQEEIDHFMRMAYGGYIDINDIDSPDQARYETYVDDAKIIQAMAMRALQAARRRTNRKYEAVFEDDDKEEGGEVVYGPGGRVMGKGKPNHMSRGDEYHKGCNRVY